MVKEGSAQKSHPGRALSRSESRSRERLRKLVEGEETEEGEAPEKKERVPAVERKRREQEEEEGLAREVDRSTSPTQQDQQFEAVGDEEETLLSTVEQETARKKGVKEAIRWLLAWIERNQEKKEF